MLNAKAQFGPPLDLLECAFECGRNAYVLGPARPTYPVAPIAFTPKEQHQWLLGWDMERLDAMEAANVR